MSNVINNWAGLEEQYGLDFVLKAIHAYERSKDYHTARNSRLKAERIEYLEWKAGLDVKK